MNLNLIKSYFTPTHILDIGCNVGEFYQLSKLFFPYAQYFLIEANKDCESDIQRLNVPYLIRALGSQKQKAVFYKNKQNLKCTGNSLYKEVTPHFSEEFLIKEEIDQYTIDTTFQEADFDLIKIDTQGSELDILKGGERIAKKAKAILLEVSVEQFNEGAPLYDEVVSFMDSYGFTEKETLYEKNQTTEYNLKIHQKDILFVNKNLL